MAGSGDIRAGRAFVEIGADTKALREGLARAAGQLKAFGSAVSAVGAKMIALGAGVLAPLGLAAKAFADMGSEMYDMSARTGVSVEHLSALGYAAEQSGASMEDLEGALRKMQKGIAQAAGGSKEAQEALGHLGLTVDDLKGKSPDEQFALIGDSLSHIKDPTVRAADAMAVFGKSGTKLLPMLEDGTDGLNAMAAEAERAGLIMSTEDAAAADSLGDALGMLWKVVKAGVFQIGAALGPALQDMAHRAAGVIKVVTDWVRQHRDLIVTVAQVAAGVLGAGVAFMVMGKGISLAGSVLGGVSSVLSTVGGALGAVAGVLGGVLAAVGPITLGLAALGAYFLTTSDVGGRAVDSLSAGFVGLKDDAVQAFGGIKGALAAGDWKLATQILWTTMKLEWAKGVNFLKGLWIDFKGWIGGIWEYLKAEFPNVVYGWGGAIAGFAVKAWGVMKQLAADLGRLWNGVVDTVAYLMAKPMVKAQTQRDLMERFAGKVVSKKDADKFAAAEYSPKLNALKEKIIDDLAKNQPGLKGRAYADELSKRFNAQSRPVVDEANKRFEGKYAGRKLTDDELQGLIDREAEKRLDDLKQNRVTEIRRRNQELKDREQAIGEETVAAADAVAKWSKDGLAMTPLEHAREAARRQKELEEEKKKLGQDELGLRRELNDLTEQAKREAEQAANASTPPEGKPKDKGPNGEDYKDLEKATLGATGTFSARAASGLAGGGPMERTAKATEDTAKNTNGLRRAIEAYKSAFT